MVRKEAGKKGGRGKASKAGQGGKARKYQHDEEDDATSRGKLLAKVGKKAANAKNQGEDVELTEAERSGMADIGRKGGKATGKRSSVSRGRQSSSRGGKASQSRGRMSSSKGRQSASRGKRVGDKNDAL